jgi:hypothetical protein
MIFLLDLQACSLAVQDNSAERLAHDHKGHEKKRSSLWRLVKSGISWYKALRTNIATNQKFHLQPLATVRNPPTIGPTQGPIAREIVSENDCV